MVNPCVSKYSKFFIINTKFYIMKTNFRKKGALETIRMISMIVLETL